MADLASTKVYGDLTVTGQTSVGGDLTAGGRVVLTNLSTGTDALAVGIGTTNASSDRGIAIGYNAIADDWEQVVIGDAASGGGPRSIAIGNNAIASSAGEGEISIGNDSAAAGSWSVALGHGSSSSGANSVAIGRSASGSQENSTSIGALSSATYYSTVVGYDADATGFWATAIGYEAKVTADQSISLGAGASTSATGGVALGYGVVVGHNYSVALGTGAASTSANQGVLGVADGGVGPYNWLIPGNLTVSGTTTISGYSEVGHDHDAAYVNANPAITGGTHTKVTYDSKGLVTGGTSLAAADIPSLAASKITSGTFADARISQSSVTQHQAALSITESQVSDLDHYTTTDANTDIDARVTKTFVDALNVNADTLDGQHASEFLNLSGGTMTGALSLTADPVNLLHAAPKQYVDSFVGNAFATIVGNGSAIEIVVSHNLGTSDVIVQTQDISDTPPTVVNVASEVIDGNTITLHFHEAPAANSIRVVVIAATEYVSGSNVVTSDDITRIVKVTQAEYDALTPDGSTLYVVVG